MMSFRWARKAVSVAAVLAASSVWAETIQYVQPASLDQPRINAFLRLPGNALPQDFDGVYNVSAFFDTGASGVLLSLNTAGYLGISEQNWTLYNPLDQQTLAGTVIFSDVGVAGSEDFYVSRPVEIALAPYHPSVSEDPPAGVDPLDYYVVHASPIRTQIGPAGADVEDPMYALLGDLDVFGVPLMRGKVVVMDPKPVDTFFDTMRTYVYDRATGQSGAVQELGPGIPTVSRHVKLSKAGFESFTTVSPSPGRLPPGADSNFIPVDEQNNPIPWTDYAPTLTDNPFIGPNPLVPGDTSAPPMILSHNGIDRPASFLLDTGAAASMISTALAAQLGITYDPNAPADSPQLLGVPLAEQFSLTVGGIGGTKKMVGFYLDGLRLPTQEAIAQNDPTLNIDFAGAPVLVGDITVMNPTTGQPFTLDGIFGMNFLVASAFISESDAGGFPVIGALQRGSFDWITYDHDAGILGLEPLTFNLEPGVVTWTGDIWAWVAKEPSAWDIGSAPNFLSGSQTVGYSDGDQVTFGDTIATVILITEPVAPGAVTFNNEVIDYIISGEAIRGYTGITKTGEALVRFENSNTFSGVFDIRGGVVELAAPQDIGPVNVQNATLLMETSQRFDELNIGSGGAASIGGSGGLVLIVGDLTIIGTGTLDLTDELLVIEAADPAHASAAAGRVEQYIADAALFSSTQAGPGKIMALIPLSQADPAAMASRFGPDWMAGIDTLFSTPLVALTADFGDLNVDGLLDGDDYFLMDGGFLARSTAYAGGDLNFDNVVDGQDFRIMDLLYLQQSMPPAAPASSVPEPASALLAAAAGLLLVRRRVSPAPRPQDRSRR